MGTPIILVILNVRLVEVSCSFYKPFTGKKGGSIDGGNCTLYASDQLLTGLCEN
jgi:hypothetical protein